jgi:hypothetical protein
VSGREDDHASTLSDDEKRELLRAVADDVRDGDTHSDQVAAMLYRVSDIYDPAEDTDARDVYVNMRNILQVKEAGGRDPEPEGL